MLTTKYCSDTSWKNLSAFKRFATKLTNKITTKTILPKQYVNSTLSSTVPEHSYV